MARLSYTRDVLLNLRKSITSSFVKRPFTSAAWDYWKHLNIARVTKRGCRGGTLRRKSPIVTVISQRERSVPLHSLRGVSFFNLVPVHTSPTLSSRDVNNNKPRASLAVWNAGSMKAKISSICDFIIDEKLDLLAITESWLRGDSRDDRVMADLKNTLPHFVMYHQPRLHRKGGGVCLLSHKGFKVTNNTVHHYRSFEYLDVIIASFTTSVRLFTIYRPPPSRKNKLSTKIFFEEFGSLLEIIMIYSGRVAMIGDFNFHVDDPTDRDATTFLELLDSTGFQQHVRISTGTHYHGHTLDLIISRKAESLVSNVSVLTGMPSDHKPVKCELNISRPPPVKVEICSRKLRGIDVAKLKEDIDDLSLSLGTVSDLVDRYDSGLRRLLDIHAPLKKRILTLRPLSPWFCDELQKVKQQKRRLERKMIKSGLTIDRQLYYDHCKIYREMLNNAKRCYHRDQIAKSNDRQLFRLIDRMCNPIQTHILPDHVSEKLLANDFASFFHKKVRDLRDNLDNFTPPMISVDICDACESTFASFEYVDKEYVRKLISQSPASSCALDPIPTVLLKSCLDPLLPHITDIINHSLSSGIVPESLKTAQVIPLLKKQGLNQNDFKNYRPISNLKFIFKVIERAVAGQLNDYLQQNGLYAPMQSAYRKFHSTETAMLRIQNDLLKAVDQHQEAVLVLLDFSAAFDTIDHDITLERLQARYGINGTPLKWFDSYLKGRTQSVNIGGILSDPCSLDEGVPQGSVLGPSLFSLYVAPLGDIITAHGISYMSYADDTQIYLTLKQSERHVAVSRLELCIRDIKSWSIHNKLMFNDSKTEVLHISSKFLKCPSFPRISIDDTFVDITSIAKSLGVTMDSTLQLKDHVNNIVSAASFAIYKIGQLSNYLDRKSTERLVHAFVTSRLDYCNSLLYGLPSNHISKLQRIQNSAARLVTRSKKHDHITPILRELHWLPVHYRINYKIALLTFKSLHGMAPDYISSLITKYSPSRCLRSSSEFFLSHPPISKTKFYGARSFTVAAPEVWNSLPANVRSLTNLNHFKRNLKTYFFNCLN